MSSACITASNLWVIRKHEKILQDVSLSVGEQDFVTIVGPNGAGKSMLLKCLIGLYKPDKGVITRKDGLRIGYVPQIFSLSQTIPLSVHRFLSLCGKQNDGDQQPLNEIAEQTQIGDILDKSMHVLSSGQLQRVLLARALINKPKLLILDEASQNMDVGGQMLFYKLLDKIYQTNAVAVLMVSHDLHFVMRSTRKVICLFHHVCCSGKPDDIAQTKEFLALFGSEMGDIMSVYRHAHKHTHE